MALFVSKRRGLRIIIRPTDRIIDESRRPVTIPGEKVEFANHRFQTNDDSLIRYLLSHPLYGAEFTSDLRDGGVPKNLDPNKVDVNALLGRGAISTVNKMAQAAEEGQAAEPQEVPEVKATSFAPTMAELDAIIDKKLEGFFGKITEILTSKNEIAQVAKPKKKFTCKTCGEEFKSGIEVGKHKKVVHPNT